MNFKNMGYVSRPKLTIENEEKGVVCEGIGSCG